MMATTQNGTHAPVPAPQPTTSALVRAQQHGGTINAFGDIDGFEAAQRMGKALSASTMVPKQYQGAQGLANCMIAIELASRIGCSVFQVMQNLDIIHGRPSWRATFLIGSVNSGGRFTPLRYRWSGEKGTDSWGCTAVATDKESGEECVGAEITWAMVKAEGWLNKDGSKWKTMPQQMFMYRSAGFWTRVYAPEAALGMRTVEEEEDAAPVRPFTGTIEVVPGATADGAIEGTDVVESFLTRIASATSEAELKALSKEIAKHPAAVGEACQASYVARKATLRGGSAHVPPAPPSDPDAADKAVQLDRERREAEAAAGA